MNTKLLKESIIEAHQVVISKFNKTNMIATILGFIMICEIIGIAMICSWLENTHDWNTGVIILCFMLPAIAFVVAQLIYAILTYDAYQKKKWRVK